MADVKKVEGKKKADGKDADKACGCDEQATRTVNSISRLFRAWVDVGTEVIGGSARAFARSLEDTSKSFCGTREDDGDESALGAARDASGSCLRSLGDSAERMAQAVSSSCKAAGDAIQKDADGGAKASDSGATQSP